MLVVLFEDFLENFGRFIGDICFPPAVISAKVLHFANPADCQVGNSAAVYAKH
jgi:hypothetical protein